MEHVAFLIEETGERLRCMLNPESIVMRRLAGLQLRRSARGLATGTALSDNPLLQTGGGITELNLDLLFDVSLSGSSIVSEDVRDLTGPIWALAENSAPTREHGRPPLVRFVWGKSWNIAGAVKSVAERLEYFTPDGVPRRSWLRLRLLRVNSPIVSAPGGEAGREPPDAGLLDLETWPGLGAKESTLDILSRAHSHETAGDGFRADGGAGVAGERIEGIAHRYYGSVALWRLVAEFNDLANPLSIAPGSLLKVPTLESLQETP